MSLWTRLWAPERPRRLAALGELAAASPQERVELGGEVEALEARGPSASPHRSEPYLAVIQAQRFWPVNQ